MIGRMGEGVPCMCTKPGGQIADFVVVLQEECGREYHVCTKPTGQIADFVVVSW